VPVPTAAETSKPPVNVVVDTPPGTVPDLRGLSAREAVRKLAAFGMSARISGSGVVVSQKPLPGDPIDAGSVCSLVLKRDAVPVFASAQP
jgi:beta-lactam-binding protein with PASTA domain